MSLIFSYRSVAVEELEKSSWKMSVVSPQAYEITAECCPDTKVSVCVVWTGISDKSAVLQVTGLKQCAFCKIYILKNTRLTDAPQHETFNQ